MVKIIIKFNLWLDSLKGDRRLFVALAIALPLIILGTWVQTINDPYTGILLMLVWFTYCIVILFIILCRFAYLKYKREVSRTRKQKE
jgi:membrane protein YdbS with pleckstrin-like domain